MKTAISLPDELFNEADHLAKLMGISRSELYQKAINEFLRKNKSVNVSGKLNAVYAQNSSELDEFVQEANLAILEDEDW